MQTKRRRHVKRLTCAIALAILGASAGSAYHGSAQPQRRVAEVRSVRPRVTHQSFVRTTVPHPVDRALPTAEPSIEPPARHRKFPAWFLRRHIATLRSTIA